MPVLTSLTHSLSFACQGSSIDKASSLMVGKICGETVKKKHPTITVIGVGQAMML